jgi:hypothetical protein
VEEEPAADALEVALADEELDDEGPEVDELDDAESEADELEEEASEADELEDEASEAEELEYEALLVAEGMEEDPDSPVEAAELEESLTATAVRLTTFPEVLELDSEALLSLAEVSPAAEELPEAEEELEEASELDDPLADELSPPAATSVADDVVAEVDWPD